MPGEEFAPNGFSRANLEWQRNWANKDTYAGVMSIVKEHGGTYGLGVEYTETML